MKEVSELTDAQLDYWVAMAAGLPGVLESYMTKPPKPIACWLLKAGEKLPDFGSGPFSPSTEWLQGGPIIERECISVYFEDEKNGWNAGFDLCAGDGPGVYMDHWQSGPTPLIAAMRAFVASKFGKIVVDKQKDKA